MENIVDYLIVLFFVISFLASIFKKKKKQIQKIDSSQKSVGSQKEEEILRQKNVSPSKTSFEDIFKAILQVPEPVESPKSEVDAYFEEAIKNSALMEAEESEDFSELRKRNQESDPAKSNSYVDAIKEIKMKHSSQKAARIRDNLRNNNSIKEYIIMNELLSKPIALRD